MAPMTRSPDGGGTERPDEEDRKDAATASTTTRPEAAPPHRDDDAAAREMERLMESGPAAMPSDRSGERTKLDHEALAHEPTPEPAVAKGARAKPRAPGSAPPRAGGRRVDPITGPVAPVEPASRRNKWTIGLVAAGLVVALGWALMRDREPRREPSATAKPPPSAPIQPR